MQLIFWAAAAILVAVDQVTKALAVAHLQPGDPKHLVGSLLRLELTRNPGAAFSTGTSHTEIFAGLAVVASVVVIWFAAKAGTALWALTLGVLLAGIVGNLVDRIARAPGGFRGHVVDFIELPHWPIFNVADMCINVAAVAILLLALRGVALSGSRSGSGTSSQDSES